MLTTIAPMFLVLVVGFLAGFASRFRGFQGALNAFVFYFGLPAFVFSAVVAAPPADRFPVGAVIIAAVVTLALSAGTYGAAHLLGSRARAGAAPTSLAATFGNVGYFGIPITLSTIGPEAALAAGIIHLVHNMIYMTGYPVVRTALGGAPSTRPGPGDAGDTPSGVGFRSAWRRRLWPIVRRAVLLNPIALSMAAALLVVMTPLAPPQVLSEGVEMIGQTAVPLALFAVGLAMHPALEGIRSGGVPKRSIALGTVVKLLLLPGVTWLAVLPFLDHLGPVWAATLVLMAAMPSSTTVFIFSEQYDGDGRLAASVLVATTVLSVVTLPLIAEFMRI
ncbi:AEC family transporter [Nesterenkonia sp. HG001]|uniref:AEC family transporter n=1 Tax=Nesterenkonia sp. HG001 TaxID=2983207 RepID=UPI002AC556D9|nr:AEC family transporter [Nesterenkonia sp. HG001]MDZ5077844.1 AEC family transporter [Nesterenkonia sp. HG001]